MVYTCTHNFRPRLVYFIIIIIGGGGGSSSSSSSSVVVVVVVVVMSSFLDADSGKTHVCRNKLCININLPEL